MKNTKKLLSIFLMLTLLLALGSQAFAATGQITVMDAGTYRYRAYKVFDAAVDPSDSTKVVYTIAADSPWLPVVYKSSTNASEIAGLKFTPDDPTSPTKYTVEELPGFSAAAFADTLRSHTLSTAPVIPSTAAVSFTTSGTTASTSDDLDSGYYLVISSSDDSFDATHMEPKAALTTVLDKPVNIQNKNDMPFDKTVDDQKTEGVKIGDVLDFKIESKVPSVDTADTFYAFLISDIMDEGLDFIKSSFTVKIGSNDVSLRETDVAEAVLTGDVVRFGKNGKTFELSLDMLQRGKPTPVNVGDPAGLGMAGQKIEITYQAKVNDKATAVVSENNAVLTYGNDPQNYTIKDSQTKVYDSRIVIDKFENGAPEQKLQDAEFTLMKYTNIGGPDGTGVDKGEAGVTAYYYKATKDTAGTVTNVEWDTDPAHGTVEITDAIGAATFTGLKDGVYYLKETKAPAGYTLLAEPIRIEVNGSHSITPGMDDNQIAAILTNVANIANTPGTVLPSTGGIGTTIFYLVGSVLVFGAAIVLILRKRSEA